LSKIKRIWSYYKLSFGIIYEFDYSNILFNNLIQFLSFYFNFKNNSQYKMQGFFPYKIHLRYLDYELVEKIGDGTFSDVIKAKNIKN